MSDTLTKLSKPEFTITNVTSSGCTLTISTVANAISYDIEYGTRINNLTNYINTTDLIKTISGLTSNTTYFFKIKAKVTVNDATYTDSDWSVVKSVTIKYVTPIIEVINIAHYSATVNITNFEASLSNTNYSDYYYEIADKSNNTSVVVDSGYLTYNSAIGNLADSTNYGIKVKIVNDLNPNASSDWSEEILFTTIAEETESIYVSATKLTNYTFKNSSSILTLFIKNLNYYFSYAIQLSDSSDFTNVIQTNVIPARTFAVVANGDNIIETTFSNLIKNKIYYARVKTVHGIIESDWSAVAKIVSVSLVLSAPTIAGIYSSSNSITISYKQVKDSNTYAIRYSTSSNVSNSITISNIVNISYTVSSLVENTTYYFQIRSENASLNTVSDWSSIYHIKTKLSNLIDVPSIKYIASSSTNISLVFTHIAHAVNYAVKCSTNSILFSNCEEILLYNSNTIYNLSPNTDYYVKIKAVAANNYVDSEWSEAYSIKTKPSYADGVDVNLKLKYASAEKTFNIINN